MKKILSLSLVSLLATSLAFASFDEGKKDKKETKDKKECTSKSSKKCCKKSAEKDIK